MSRSSIFKWAMLIMLLLMDVFTTIALLYSVFQSQVLITGSDPFILNVALIFAVIDIALWVITFFMIYEIKTDSSLNKRVTIIEKLLSERGVNNHR
jgi:hypothetical protein